MSPTGTTEMQKPIQKLGTRVGLWKNRNQHSLAREADVIMKLLQTGEALFLCKYMPSNSPERFLSVFPPKVYIYLQITHTDYFASFHASKPMFCYCKEAFHLWLEVAVGTVPKQTCWLYRDWSSGMAVGVIIILQTLTQDVDSHWQTSVMGSFSLSH